MICYQDVTCIDPVLFTGKKLVLLDIDNTLFLPETTEIRKEILAWFHEIQKKFCCVCVSNSASIAQRRGAIVDILGCDVFISRYKKPSRKLFQEMLKAYHVSARDVIVIGDFLFTDVMFARRNGAVAVLVRPLARDASWKVRMLRGPESLLVFLLSKDI